MKRLLISIVCFVLPVVTHAAIRNAASCNATDVQAAINSAADGDIVTVPAGNCTWSNAGNPPSTPWDLTSVYIRNKTITLQGAGPGAGGTTINYGGAGHSLLTLNPGSKTGRMDISGFRFVGGDANYWNGTAIIFAGPYQWKNLRIHNIWFDSNTQYAIKGDSFIYGVIDNCTFSGNVNGILTYGRGTADWTTSLTLGTDDFLFVENNTFNYPVGLHAMYDLTYGGRTVFRYNTVKHGLWETHDRARGGTTSVSGQAWEVYGNSFRTDASNDWKAIDIASGTGVVWGNRIDGAFSYPVGGIDYKSFDPRSLPLCDGNDTTNDQNTSGQTGWRCQYQIGTWKSGVAAETYAAYIWNNTIVNGSGSPGMVVTDGANHVQANRDFYNYTASFNGTSGVGSGLLANRPSTCTAGFNTGGVGYWATDTNTLYRCSATNTWTVHYKPYTYPHPLTVGLPPIKTPNPPSILYVQ